MPTALLTIAASLGCAVPAPQDEQHPAAPIAATTLQDPAVQDPAATSWPSYHGPMGRGYADGYVTPSRWDVESGENIAWTTDIPGLSHSSPVVWGDRVWVHLDGRSGWGVGDLRRRGARAWTLCGGGRRLKGVLGLLRLLAGL